MEICSIFQKNCHLHQKADIFTAKLSIILMIILNSTQTSVCSPDWEFVSQPLDVSAKEDTSASFHCTLTSRVPFSSANSYWENGLTETLRRIDLYNVTTIPDTSNQMIRSYLTINKVQRDMSKLYKCWIMINFLDDSRNIISSDFARLNVLYFLSDNELRCSGPSSSVLREGDQIDIECKGVQTNPSSVLRWLQSFPASSSLFQTTFSQAGSLLLGNITATPLLHKNVLVCVAESEAFLEERVNCSLGPFKVIHSPVVEIVPAHAEMIWPLVTEMKFQCIASGYPDVNGYEWFCHPEEVFTQCSSNVSTLTIITENVRTERILNISCEARNDVSKTQRISTISVKYIAQSMIPTCNSSTSDLPQISYHGKLTIKFNAATCVVQCSAEVQNIELTVFRWYLDGILIAENDGEHDVVKSSEGGSHLAVYDSLTLTRRPGIVACSIRYNKYDELRTERLAACTLSYAYEDYAVTNSTESLQAMAYSDITSSEQQISVKTTQERGNISLVSYSIQQHQDSETISERSVSTPNFHSYFTTSSSESKGLANGFQIFAIPALTASGTLFILITIIAVMRKSGICKFAGPDEPCVQLPAPEEMQFDIRRSSTCDVEEDRCYEIPDPEIRPSNPSRCREINTHFSPMGTRHVDIDSLMEGESASKSSTESTGNLTNSSHDSTEKDSYLQDEESDAPCLHHYENQDVVESITKKAGSKYFRARMAEIEGKEKIGYERRIHSDIRSSSSTESSSM